MIHRLFRLWVLLGIAIPFALGYAIDGTLGGALAAALWGGAVRIFLLHHVTWSINSVCHFFGTRRFAVDDHSTNVFWLSVHLDGRVLAPQPPRLPALGLPRPALVGDRPHRLRDPRHEGVRLAWNVVEIPKERQEAKRARVPSRRLDRRRSSAVG